MSSIAGPLSTLALFRRIGEATDAVCARFGALRVGQGESSMQLGWFPSQHPNEFPDDDESGIPAKLCMRGVLGACELARRVLEHLRTMNVGLGVSVGVSCGETSVAMLGRHPTTLVFQDKVPDTVGHGPLAYSKRLSRIASDSRVRDLPEATAGIVVLCEDCKAGLQPAFSWFSKFLVDKSAPPERLYGLSAAEDKYYIVDWASVLGLADLHGLLPYSGKSTTRQANQPQSILLQLTPSDRVRMRATYQTVPIAHFDRDIPRLDGIDWIGRLIKVIRDNAVSACESELVEDERTNSNRTSSSKEFHGAGINEWL